MHVVVVTKNTPDTAATVTVKGDGTIDWGDSLDFGLRTDGVIRRVNDVPGVEEDADLVMDEEAVFAAIPEEVSKFH